MGNGWHEWPLVLFTVLGQCVAGALIVSGYGWLTTKDDAVKQRIVRSMFFLWLVMGIAFLASVMHLGSPLRAFNSLNRIGASALSNEIASGSLFFAVGGLWWLVAFLGKMPAALGKIWLLLSMLLGLVFVYAMTNVYQIDTVPTWYNGHTTLAFFMTMLLSGPLFAALLLRAAGVSCSPARFAGISVLALLVTVAVVVLQGLSLCEIHSSVQNAGALVPEGREVPPRAVMVGVPAKQIRTLTDEEVAQNAADAALYVEIGKQMERDGIAAAGANMPRNIPAIGIE